MKRTESVRRMVHTLVLAAVLGCAGAAGGADRVAAVAPDEGAVTWFECGGFPKGCEGTLVWGDWERTTHGYYVRAPKGYVFPRHAHTHAERILVLRGRIAGAVDGGGEMLVTPGMYWGFEGKAVHWARCEDACLMYITYDGSFDVKFH